jgi:hypothetical protein
VASHSSSQSTPSSSVPALPPVSSPALIPAPPHILGHWRVERITCDGRNATDSGIIISDLFTSDKELSFNFSNVEGRESGELTVVRTIRVDQHATYCRLNIPFTFELTRTRSSEAVVSGTSGMPEFSPPGCNNPSVDDQRRRRAGRVYSTLRPLARYLGLSDPISTIGAYADPVLGLLGQSVRTRDIIFGQNEVPQSLLSYYIPHFFRYHMIAEGEGAGQIELNVPNYFGCRNRNDQSLTSFHNAVFRMSRVPELAF